MKAILLVALALAGCATVPPAPLGPTAGLGQYAEAGGLRIRPIRVIEDSRCLANVQCVWAGRLVVETEVGGVGPLRLHQLELGKPSDLAGAGGTVTMVAAEPGKIAGAAIPPAAYRFTFQRGP
jgi:hypothetical protein